jgi:ubiquinone/menaquinone biosynthesis C-methylase UbiE/c-di-GMP-binding flagellar brake protein YcgR/dienelactone hydrolase
MIERRKNIRIALESGVQFISGNQIYQGKLVDISQGGMKLAADIPVSTETIKDVTFSLPNLEKPLQIPCKLVRKEKENPNEKSSSLGIQFIYEDEAQMHLIESFIKEKKMGQLKAQTKNAELRQIPRTDCVINQISCDSKGVRVLSIDNISIDGVLISYRGKGLSSHDEITLTFLLPDDTRILTVSGIVTYIKENAFKDTSNAGIVFNNISELDRIRIKNFISSYTFAAAMKALHERFSDVRIDERYAISDQSRIDSIFSLLAQEKIHMNVLFEHTHKMLELSVTNYDPRKRTFSIDRHAYISNLSLEEYHLSYFSFNLNKGTYHFKTNLLELLDKRAAFSLPAAIYQSEKRSHQRKIAGENIVFTFFSEGKSKGAVQGVIINTSEHGFMCELPLEEESKDFFQPGMKVNYRTNEELGLGTFGKIRHVSENTTQKGKKMLQLGIESGIRYAPFQFTRYSQADWEKQNMYRGDLPLSAREKMSSILVNYPNRKGQKIKALVNSTHKKITAPVVILPPAFGKKKEALSPLVSTLITNARCFDKEIVTIRYDGINRPGESYNEEMLPKRGYEMLYYRMSQGLDDLKATIDYVHHNPYFKPSRVIVVAFSMSSLDVRKLVSKSDDHKIDHIINVMGVSCGQSAFKNMTGGLDIIGNYRLGIKNGQFGILGHMLDLDNLAEDLIARKYAYMTDARLDMSRISIPILWIYGKYDKWIDENEVKELMGIESKGSREVIEIPTGHNIRTSEDAIKTFKLIASWIQKKLYNENIIPFEPDRNSLVKQISYERERILTSEDFDIQEYWKEYLIGKSGKSFGYDFYKNIKEFRDFLTFQSELIDMQDNERIADMGCGTGLVIENMLDLAVDQQRDVRNTQLITIDLIKEALDKTETKVKKIQKLHKALLPMHIRYIVKDLEPNRLIPVYKFINNMDLDLNCLRNRIEGLTNTAVDRFLSKSSKRMYEIMRGALISRSDEAYLKSEFKDEDHQIIKDLNRAARFLKRELEEKDFAKPEPAREASVDSLKYDRLNTSDLKFNKLNFGHNGLQLHLNFEDNYFDKIIASLFISYLFNPDEIFPDFYRMLKPNGLLLVSSMKPDSDISLIFTNYVDKVRHFDFSETDIKSQDISLIGAREMLNEAATLFELEEDGYFKFFSKRELVAMFKTAGFDQVQVHSSMGNPPQAFIVTGRKVKRPK